MRDDVVEGHWWVSGLENADKVPGVLTIEPSGRTELSLIGAFGGQRRPGDTVALVLGSTLQGKPISLTGTWMGPSESGGWDATPSRQVIHAERVIDGVHLDQADSAVFTSARVRIENLDAWTNLSAFVRQPLPDSTDPTARVCPHEPVEFSQGEFRFRLRHVVGQFDFQLTRVGVDVIPKLRGLLYRLLYGNGL